MKIRVSRFDPERERAPRLEEFDVSGVDPGESVLGVLQRIRESVDSTLAFRFGCRFKGCGLCTVEIDGRALPACMIRATEGMEVGPLRSFPVLRDLVVDRRPLTAFFARQQLYLDSADGEELPVAFEVPPATPSWPGAPSAWPVSRAAPLSICRTRASGDRSAS